MLKYLALTVLILAGCQSYHVGTSLPEEQRQIALYEVKNLTREHRLSFLLTNALSERLEGIPGVDVVNDKDAGLQLKVEIKSLDQRRQLSAELREKDSRKDDSDGYQTVIFRLTAEATWQATPVGKNGGAVRSGRVTGVADLPSMADHETALANALREVARDLARKISAQVTEL